MCIFTSTSGSLRALVLAALVTAGATATAQTPATPQSPSSSPSDSASSPEATATPRPYGPGRYMPGQHHGQRDERGMMGGGMGGGMGAMPGRDHMPPDRHPGGYLMGPHMGGHMMGMMGGCPVAAALPPGNEKLAMRMHGEIMVAIGNILIKNADNIQSKPSD